MVLPINIVKFFYSKLACLVFLKSFQRPLWRHYYQNTDVLIFVIDSNDRERMPECCDELQRFLGEEELKDSFILVLANKQDLPNAMSVDEITEELKLNCLKDRAWRKFISFVNESIEVN